MSTYFYDPYYLPDLIKSSLVNRAFSNAPVSSLNNNFVIQPSQFSILTPDFNLSHSVSSLSTGFLPVVDVAGGGYVR